MSQWERVEKPGEIPTWTFVLRVLTKAALLFGLCNLTYAVLTPLEALGEMSIYNVVVRGRERLPYGENPSESYNLSLFNIPAMFASHVVARPKADDEFRVLLIGDSSAWGWLLENRDTLAGKLNAGGYVLADGRRVVLYNLGYPIMSLTKDLMLLDYAMRYEPDMVVWLLTLASFPGEWQLDPLLVRHNAERVRALIVQYSLDLDAGDSRFVTPDFLGRTIVGERRALADWLRLQVYGIPWALTGIDQAIPAEYELRRSDFDVDVTWEGFEEPIPLSSEHLALDVLDAGLTLAGDVPVLIVNEPMFVSGGRNSALRYNAFYPRWAYDSYRELLAEAAGTHSWLYLDLWDMIPAPEFTDSPVHLTPEGNAQLGRRVAAAIVEVGNGWLD